MSDIVIRRFRAQLIVAMDAVLRKSVIDIMSLFENSVCDYQKELSLKDGQLVQLTKKLKRAELQLMKIDSVESSQVVKKDHIPQNNKALNGCNVAHNVVVDTANAAIVTSKKDVCVDQAPQKPPMEDDDDVRGPSILGKDQKLTVGQDLMNECEVVKVDVDSHRPTTANKSSSGSFPEDQKKLQRRKRKHVKQSPEAKGDVVIYLTDIKARNSGGSVSEKTVEKLKKKTPVVPETASDPNAAHFVLKKRVTAKESDTGEVQSMTCDGCQKSFPSADARRRHLKSCKRERLKKETNGRVLRSSRSPREGNDFSCGRCSQKFNTSLVLALHRRKCMDGKSDVHSWTEPIEDDL